MNGAKARLRKAGAPPATTKGGLEADRAALARALPEMAL
jgi:hypothetical protein